MTEIISVRFQDSGKHYYFDPGGQQVRLGQDVIVETSRGPEYGWCVGGNRQVEDDEVVAPLRPLLRLATEEDRQILKRNREREALAFQVFAEKAADHGLDMKPVEARCSFDGSKYLFFFTAEGRVDFRALVRDLAGTLHARIELRQIGVRDEAKLLGGLGICGRPFCCAQFLDGFQPVSIKMAKTQNLSLNPTKISGACGRLMCCLKYEQEAYEDLVKRAPRQESFVETPDGAGVVSNVNLLRERVQVRLESDPDSPKTYHNSEVRIVRSGKGKRPEGYVQPPQEELEKLRRAPEERPPEPARASTPLAAALEAVFNGEIPRIEGEEPRARRNRSRKSRPQQQTVPAKQQGAPSKREKKADRPRRQEEAESPAGGGQKNNYRRRFHGNGSQRPQE